MTSLFLLTSASTAMALPPMAVIFVRSLFGVLRNFSVIDDEVRSLAGEDQGDPRPIPRPDPVTMAVLSFEFP